MGTASRGRRLTAGCLGGVVVLTAACTGGGTDSGTAGGPSPTRTPASQTPASRTARPPSTAAAPTPTPTSSRAAGTFTLSFAGDVHFSGRVRDRLDHDPATVFAQAAPGLRRADLTMVNLETAITTGGSSVGKEFTFRAPPRSLVALRDAGIDVATMANNHGADYGEAGLRDSLAAGAAYRFPIIGIGADARAAFAPYTATLHGTKVAIIAADQVQDETTLRLYSAGRSTPGVANAFSPRLVAAVRAARAAGYVVVVYLHWGVEFHTCPSALQTGLADRLAAAGATAVIGTHAHVLQGAGWRQDGTYVAYGLGNYLWWKSFGNDQDDNGVLTLTFRGGRVVSDDFAPAHLDERGVPVPASGSTARRIDAEFAADRQCAGLAAHAPS